MTSGVDISRCDWAGLSSTELTPVSEARTMTVIYAAADDTTALIRPPQYLITWFKICVAHSNVQD